MDMTLYLTSELHALPHINYFGMNPLYLMFFISLIFVCAKIIYVDA